MIRPTYLAELLAAEMFKNGLFESVSAGDRPGLAVETTRSSVGWVRPTRVADDLADPDYTRTRVDLAVELTAISDTTNGAELLEKIESATIAAFRALLSIGAFGPDLVPGLTSIGSPTAMVGRLNSNSKAGRAERSPRHRSELIATLVFLVPNDPPEPTP